LDLGSGSSLTLIGAPTEARTFSTITGSGTIKNQGGANTFNTAAGAGFEAGGGTATVTSGTFTSLSLTGAYLGGKKISATSATLNNGFLNGGLHLSVDKLTLQGTVEIDDDGTNVMVTQSASVPVQSLITMTGGSSLQISTGATVTQTAQLQIVPGAPKANKPSVTSNGSWSTSATLSIAEIPLSGTGMYSLSGTGAFSFNNVAFSAKTVESQGSITAQIGTFTANSVTGTGTILAAPLTMTINQLAGNTFTLLSGSASVNNLTLSTLEIKNGVFGLGTSGQLTTFKFEGGQFKGTGTTQATLAVRDTVLSGVTTQTLTNTAVTTTTFSMNCGANACQLFSQNSAVRTVSS